MTNYVFYCSIYNTQDYNLITIFYALSHKIQYKKEAHKQTKLERSKLKDKWKVGGSMGQVGCTGNTVYKKIFHIQ